MIKVKFQKKDLISITMLKEQQELRLVGPQRDDIFIYFEDDKPLKLFGSRGQQRLGVLQLKLIELNYIKEKLETSPILLLDDIFSELDEEHINLILGIINDQQTILTTTHEEFIPGKIKSKMEIIELGK